MSVKAAIASSDGVHIDLHFGKCAAFRIYELGDGGEFREAELRTIDPGCIACGSHDDGGVGRVIEALSDCRAVAAARIGGETRRCFGAREIDLFDGVSDVAETLNRLAKFYNRQRRIPLRHERTGGENGQ